MSPTPPISSSEIVRIAALCRIGLEPEEIEALSRELGRVLEYFAIIDGLGIAAAESAPRALGPIRPDDPDASLAREDLLSNAPRTVEGFFAVRRVIP